MSERQAVDLEANLAGIREGIASACARAGRSPGDVTLIAASKFVASTVVQRARTSGVRDFGENYVKELREKRAAVPDARWHYVGVLQSNTAHLVADDADVVHSLEPGRAVERLARRAEAAGRRIPSLIQVDFTGERAGTDPADLEGFAEHAAGLAGLEVAGLMMLPPMPKRPDDARPWFAHLRELRDRLRETYPGIVELSMGMSLDYEVAVEEGATMVRVGAALFGDRPKAPAR